MKDERRSIAFISMRSTLLMNCRGLQSARRGKGAGGTCGSQSRVLKVLKCAKTFSLPISHHSCEYNVN